MRLFGRGKKCYKCGGTYDLKRCECGRYYCGMHGFGGKCYECQANSMGKIVPSLDRVQTREDQEEAERKKAKGELIPREIRASISYEGTNAGDVRENLILELKRFHRVLIDVMKIKVNREIICYYYLSYIASRYTVDAGSLHLVTDLTMVPERLKRDEMRGLMASERPLQDEVFTYYMRYLHNETLFLLELIVRSLGGSEIVIENDLEMEKVRVKRIGFCPFCGTLIRGRESCPTCKKEIPNEMDLRTFLKMHSRRQFMDKLYAVRSTPMREDARKDHVAKIRSRLRALDEM